MFHPVRTTAVLALAGLLTGPALAAEVSWRLGSPVGPEDVATLDMVEYAERVAARSNGEIEIEVIPLESIGFKPADSLRVLKQGVLDAMNVVPYYVDRDEPLLSAFMPHGGLMDPEDNFKIIDVQHEIAAEIYAKWDVIPVGRIFAGALKRQTLVSRVPVSSLEDLRKIKLRHFTKIGIDSFNALGVSTQTLPSSELYLALKTGVVDGSLYAPIYTKSQSIYEVACCSSFIGVFSAATPFIIGANAQSWAALSDGQKAILQSVASEMYEENIEKWRNDTAEAEAIAYLREQDFEILDPFPEEDRKAIQQATWDQWRLYAESLGPDAVRNYERIVAALRDE
ncbi:MAG: TRAP transporter substrate-binding protein DctP [Pseudomonadota bacterium]